MINTSYSMEVGTYLQTRPLTEPNTPSQLLSRPADVSLAKVTVIEDSKDLTSLSLDELIGNLKVHEMIIKKYSEIVKAKVERKSLALKAKKKYSDEECSTSGSEDEEYAMAVRDFKKCGDPNHLIGECPKPPKDKNQRAFVGGSWSNSGEEDDEKVKDKMWSVLHASNEAKIVESKSAIDIPSSWGSNATDILSSSSLVMIGIVRFGNDHIARIMGYGDYQLGNVTISRVYYVERLGHNLFSVAQFCDADLESRNELLKTMQSLGEMLRQREQADNFSTHTPEPSRSFNSICYDDDDDEEGTIPLNENISPNSSVILQSPPVLTLVEDLIPIPSEFKDTSHNDSECDLPFCDDSPPLDVLGGNSVTFSNPLFDSNDDFTSSNDESLPEEDVQEENFKIYSNLLFEFYEEYISSDINTLYNEVLEDIERNDSYVSNLDEPVLLVTLLSDAKEDECFDPGGDIDEIDAFLDIDVSMDIEDGYHDLKGDIIYLESLFINDTIPNLPPEVFLDHDPRSLNDEPNIDALKIKENMRFTFEDRHYLFLTFVIQIFLPFLTYPMNSLLLLSSGSEDTIFDPGISAYSFYSLEPMAYESPMMIFPFFFFCTNDKEIRAVIIRLRAEAPSTSYSPPPHIILSHTKADTPPSGTPPSGTPTLLPIPLPTSSPPLHLLSTNHRADRLEVTLPPQKRLGIALGLRYKVGESSSAPTARPPGGFRADYGFVATMDREIRRDLERDMTEFATRVRQDTNEIYVRLYDEQTERQVMAGRLNMLYRDRRAHARKSLLMKREARMSREAWGRSMDASDLARSEVMSLRTTVLGQQAVITELQAADRRRQEINLNEYRLVLEN
ncbi:hypothetical protein Tco_1560748 [Tanacetum coccineum]